MLSKVLLWGSGGGEENQKPLMNELINELPD